MKGIRRGQIYIADMEPVRGSEEGKTRRVLIVSNDIGNERGPVVICVPITASVDDRKKRLPMYVFLRKSPENGQTKDALIDCGQIRVISKEHRLIEYKGFVDKGVIEAVDRRLELSLGLRRCFRCDYVLLPNKRNCVNPKCGILLEDICTNCSSVVDVRHNFCPMCGKERSRTT